MKFLLCWPSCAGQVLCIPRETRLEKSYYYFAIGYKLEIASGLEMWACDYFFSQCWEHIWTKAYTIHVHVVPVFMILYVSQTCCI